MLSSTLTLAVDEANDGIIVDLEYTRYDEYNNRTVYISENHEPGMEDKLTFYRTFPTSSGNFKGTRKTAFKLSRDVTVLGVDGNNVNSTSIAEVSFSLPIGVSAAEAKKIRQGLIAALDNDTLMVALHERQNV